MAVEIWDEHKCMAGFNLVPVTLGNIVGAALFVAALYWYVYLRGPLCTVKKS